MDQIQLYQILKEWDERLDHPEGADKLEADIRKNFDKLMSNQSRIAAKAAGRAVDVSADDFDDAD